MKWPIRPFSIAVVIELLATASLFIASVTLSAFVRFCYTLAIIRKGEVKLKSLDVIVLVAFENTAILTYAVAALLIVRMILFMRFTETSGSVQIMQKMAHLALSIQLLLFFYSFYEAFGDPIRSLPLDWELPTITK
jgi:hypothetical protein